MELVMLENFAKFDNFTKFKNFCNFKGHFIFLFGCDLDVGRILYNQICEISTYTSTSLYSKQRILISVPIETANATLLPHTLCVVAAVLAIGGMTLLF